MTFDLTGRVAVVTGASRGTSQGVGEDDRLEQRA